MPKTIIASNPSFRKPQPTHENYLDIAEFFCDTIQGENFAGYPATFLRTRNCTLACSFCDTSSVWRYGNPYTFDELFEMIFTNDLIHKFHQGQHLVLTGGSPLKQQRQLVRFLNEFKYRYDFLPYIEIENECTIMPTPEMAKIVSMWNNSPKLSNSYNMKEARLHPDVLMFLSSLKNSWFKFVINSEEDWTEILEDFIKPGLILTTQIVLMPMASTKEELEANQQKVVEIAIRENVRYCSRLHVNLWGKTTGV